MSRRKCNNYTVVLIVKAKFMEILLKGRLKIILVSIAVCALTLALLYLFGSYGSFFIFKDPAHFINKLLGIERRNIFAFMDDVPLILWFSSLLFLIVSVFIMKRIKHPDLKIPLKINFILLSILCVYTTYIMLEFYLATFKVINYDLKKLVLLF